eukprot:TRINITY_DN4162_c2_g1_i1.p1 TRINITY_DN4162_c2_g1~~TRINITY_DN4162_c2_g1_i1.p1  ORF type:complete len:483 (+),score=74.40 TRINITY_DN4162_c2_g1_i1:276-1724(+)
MDSSLFHRHTLQNRYQRIVWLCAVGTIALTLLVVGHLAGLFQHQKTQFGYVTSNPNTAHRKDGQPQSDHCAPQTNGYQVVHLVHLHSVTQKTPSWYREFEWVRTQMFSLLDSTPATTSIVSDSSTESSASTKTLPWRVVAVDPPLGGITNVFCNNTIIVDIGFDTDRDEEIKQYISTARTYGVNILGGVHLNDDQPDCHTKDEHYSWYQHVPFVFRTYWSERLHTRFGDRLRWMPLGWQTGFGPVPTWQILQASHRPNFCSFFGASRSEANRGFSQETRCYNMMKSSASLNVRDYSHLVLSSAVVLCPGTQNRENFRIYDALEAGAIPVIDRSTVIPPSSGSATSTSTSTHTSTSSTTSSNSAASASYFTTNNRRDFPNCDTAGGGDLSAFDPFDQVQGWDGPCPLPAVANWERDLPAVLDQLEDPEEADRVQQRVMAWWALVKRRWQVDVQRSVTHTYREPKPVQHTTHTTTITTATTPPL